MTTPIPLADQLRCAKRELHMRLRVYPRWVESGRMSLDDAGREIATMRAIVDTLAQLEHVQGRNETTAQGELGF